MARRGYVTKPLSFKEIRRLARLMANDQLAPQRRDLIAGNRRYASQLAGLGQALGSELSGISTRVGDAYSDAADQSAAYSQGYAETLNELGGGGAGAVLAGLGAENAGRMARSGALLEAHAAAQPGIQALVAQQRLAASNDALNQGLKGLEAQRPGLARQALQDLLAQELQKRGLDLNAQSLGLDADRLAQDNEQFYAGLYADATGGADKQRTKKQQARVDAWWANRNDALDLAKELYGRTKAGLGDVVTPDPVPYATAYRQLWARYGKELVARFGYRRQKVVTMLRNMLVAAGYPEPAHDYEGGN